MEKEKILEGVEEGILKALELEMDNRITFERTIFTKNKKYYLSTVLEPLPKEDKTQTKEVRGGKE